MKREERKHSDAFNVVKEGAPSLILNERRISFGMTILPKSSILLTMPVAFILYLSNSFSFVTVIFCTANRN